MLKIIELLTTDLWKLPLKTSCYKMCANQHFEKLTEVILPTILKPGPILLKMKFIKEKEPGRFWQAVLKTKPNHSQKKLRTAHFMINMHLLIPFLWVSSVDFHNAVRQMLWIQICNLRFEGQITVSGIAWKMTNYKEDSSLPRESFA